MLNKELRQALALIYANAHATASSTPEQIRSLYEEAMQAYEYKPTEEPNQKTEWPFALRD